MCVSSNVGQIISYIYLGICFLIPIIYLFKFCKYKSKKKKNYLRAIIIALIMFLLFYSIKFIVKASECGDCLLNGVCEETKVVNKNSQEKTTTTSTTKSTTSTSTTTTSTTKTTKSSSSETYKAPDVPAGEQVYVGETSNGFKMYTINGATYIDGVVIANKTYSLGENYVPQNTYKSAVGVTSVCNTCLDKDLYSAWTKMSADAKALGLNIWIQSGYRPYSSQKSIYNSYLKKDSQEVVDTYSSRPGHSDHQTGLAFDLNSITDAFGNTSEGKWIDQNCYKYGFIIRFPKGKSDYTGYKYESWHLRYVGTELSYKLYNNGDWLSLEEYFGITSVYD